MIERIDENNLPTARWEALLRYRNASKNVSATPVEIPSEQVSQEAKKRPETAVSPQDHTESSSQTEKTKKQLVLEECETCKERRYVDKSDDGSVSFQTPTHIPASSAGPAVLAHEGEHVINEQTKAKEQGRKVIDQRVELHTVICPECVRIYISGGLTTTVTAPDDNKPAIGIEQEDEVRSRFDVHI